MQSPLPTTEGWTKDKAESLRINQLEELWRKSDEFVCVACGEPAYLHPYTNHIWGCKRCVFTTYSVSVRFKPSGTNTFERRGE